MNITQPSDTPRTNAVFHLKPGLWRDWNDQQFSELEQHTRRLERELNQLRACAEKLAGHARHAVWCKYPEQQNEPCLCGLNKAREIFEKLKGEK